MSSVDFDLRRGEIHALLGENGAGKTTLMNLLYGLLQPDEGTMEVDGSAVSFHSPQHAIEHGIGMVHQHFKLVPRLTVTENVILGSNKHRGVVLPDLARVGREIEQLGGRYGLPISASALVRDLSVGEQQRVEILRALYQGVKILILDEPTASLTPIEVDSLLEKLRRLADDGTSVVIITHHLDEVMSAADRVTVLRGGTRVTTVEAADTNQRELARLMVGRDVAMLLGPGAATRRAVPDSSRAILRLEGLTSHRAAGGGSEHERGYSDVHLDVHAGEIVTIAGVEGNGQTELEATLLGLRRPAAGRYVVDGRDVTHARPAQLLMSGIGFVHSDRYRRGLIREMPIAHNLVYDRIGRAPFGNRFSIDFVAIAARGAEVVNRFSILARSPNVAAGTLSGGNAQKVVLARAFSSRPRLVIAAQPTRGLDVGAIEFVWEQLRAQRDAGAAILLITTDLEEVLGLADRCYVIYRGGLTETPVDRERIGMAMGGIGVEDAGVVGAVE